jgi:hypothetical protein
MKLRKGLILFFLLLNQLVFAQEIKLDSITKLDKNLAKINLIGFSINGQYERILSKRISVALSYRVLPNGKFLFRGLIPTTDPQARESLDNLMVSNSAITPEVRFYLGKKGFGQGIYLAPFFRSAKFSGKGLGIDFTLDSGQPATFNMEGSIKSNTFGLLIGAQWKLGKNFWLDWQILGPHYGSANGTITGTSNLSLSAAERTSLENALKDITVPFIKQNVSVSPNEAIVDLKGPWAGLRTGVSLGFSF